MILLEKNAPVPTAPAHGTQHVVCCPLPTGPGRVYRDDKMVCRFTAFSTGRDLASRRQPSAAHLFGHQCGVSKNARPTARLRAACSGDGIMVSVVRGTVTILDGQHYC